MSRYAPTTNPQDTTPRVEGDDVFTGVNAKLSAELVPQGYVTDAVNLRFRRNKAETREGLITPVSHRWSAGAGTHTILGSGIFSDPLGVEWLLLATPHKIVQCRAGYTPRTVAIPDTLAGPVSLVQAFNQVILFRGSLLTPWAWDGTLSSAGFVEISQAVATNDDITSPIPNGPDKQGLAPVLMNNRLLVPYNGSQIAVSDILDYTRYDATLDDFNVNNGSEDVMTALFPYANNTLLVLKDASVFAIYNVSGDLSGTALDRITADVGCVAGRSAAMVGGDVFWLSARGVFRLQQLLQGRLQTAAMPVSDPIQPIVDRIHWPAAGGAVAAVHREYYSLAVPLDGSTVNNAILPFNTVTGAWEGVHTFPAGVQIDALHVADYFGRKELWAVDYAAGLVYLMYYGFQKDRVGEVPSEIATSLTTRGYRLGTNAIERFRRSQISLETSNAAMTIAVQPEGVNRGVTLVSNLTRSRTAYLTFNKPAFAGNNVNDDHATPGRLDYSVVPPFQTRSGINLNRVQAIVDKRPMRVRGRFATLTIANTSGYAAVTSVQVEGDETDRAQRAAI